MAGSDPETGKENITLSLIRKILDMTEEQQLSLYQQLEEISATAIMTSEREDTRKSFRRFGLFNGYPQHIVFKPL